MRNFRLNTLLAALVLAGSAHAQAPAGQPQAGAAAPAAAASAPTGPTVRPEVGKHLIDAQQLLTEKKYPETKEALKRAMAVPDRQPYEDYLIALVSLNVAVNEDDAPNAAKYMEQFLALNEKGQWAKPKDVMDLLQNVGVVHYRTKQYAQAAEWMERNLKAGGTHSAAKNVRIQAYLLAGNYQRSSELAEEEIALAQKENRPPVQSYLEILGQSRGQLKDSAGGTRAIEMLVTHYPKKEYWQSLVNRLWTRPDLTPALHLDVYRLGLYANALQETTDFAEYVEFAQRAGFSAEALQVFDKGVEAGLMGTGENVEAHKKLRVKLVAEAEQDRKTALADAANVLKKPNPILMLNLGFNLVGQGQFEKGIELMEKGIAKGVPKRPDDARLHLAIAYVLAGQTDKAQTLFGSITGKEGLTELARYWTLAIRKP